MWWGEKVGGEELPRRVADRWLIERNSVAVLPDEIGSVESSGEVPRCISSRR